jgi:outer membrane protein TolC
MELDLRGALERAPQANFQLLLAQEGIVSQEQATRMTRSALLPQVQLSSTQMRAMAPNVDPLSKSFPGIPTRFYVERFDAVLQTSLTLLNMRSVDDWRESKLTLKAAEWQLEDAMQEILQQISVTYFTHWRNVRRLSVIDANLERDRILLQIARDQMEAGVATALEVTRAEVGLAVNELTRLQQETAVMESMLQLKQVLNIPLETDLQLKDEAFPDATGESEFSSFQFEQVLGSRADYHQLKTELDREALALRATKRERLPSLTLSGQWGYASETWSDDLQEQWAIQLGLTMPVFEGFRIEANQRMAASALKQKELQLSELRLQIEADYRLVLQELQSLSRQVEVARRARDLNQKEYELEKIRFEEGVADNSDVVDAQAALADAGDALVDAEFQYYLARIRKARIEGNVHQVLQD